jgi:hypothetical protein
VAIGTVAGVLALALGGGLVLVLRRWRRWRIA